MVSLEDLGVSSFWKPSPRIYKFVMDSFHFIVDHIKKDFLDVHGLENLDEDYYQLFLCGHKFYFDPVPVQGTIIRASNNSTPIPCPSKIKYVGHKILGPFLISSYCYPLYSEADGPTKREKSLQYSVERFLEHERFLIYPEGKTAGDGKLALGKRGAAELAWRVYHCMQEDSSLKKKKGIKMIPVDVSYYPIVGWTGVDKIALRFGKAINFKEEVIDKFYDPKNKTKNPKKLKKELEIKLMGKVMKEIGSLTTINMDSAASRVVYNLAEQGYFAIRKDQLEEKLQDFVGFLNNSDLHLLDHFKDKESVKKAYDSFLRRCKKKKVIKEDKGLLNLNLDYILSNPNFKDIRKKNFILYNYNLLEHIKDLKSNGF